MQKIGSLGLRESRAGPEPRLEACLLLNQIDEKDSLGGKSTGFGMDCLGLEPPLPHWSCHLQQIIQTLSVSFLVYTTELILIVCSQRSVVRNE